MKKSIHGTTRLALRFDSAAHWSAKLWLAVWFSALALTFGAQGMRAATVTYIVGTCTSGTHFSTIQAALDASPAPDTVKVCPGVYNENIVITKPVTLEGIVAGNGALAQIELSDSAPNVTLGIIPATAQIYVNNVSGGDVNLTNLYVGGQGFSPPAGIGYLVGIVYQQSSGTINHVITSTQDDNGNPALNVYGFGIWIEGGSSKLSVTVENCSIHDFTEVGMVVVGASTATDLTVMVKNNVVSAASEGAYNIYLSAGSDPTVSGNIVNGGETGITVEATEGSITGNTILGSQTGIEIGVDGASVASNNVYDTVQYGIAVYSELKESVVENNTIRTVKSASSTDSNGTGIELFCHKVGSQVHANTIMDSYFGYGDAPAGFAGSNNTYAGVAQDVEACSSSGPSKVSALARPKWLGQPQQQ